MLNKTDFSDSQELQGNEATLIGYWKLNNTYTDSTGNTTLTTANTPTFSTDVPFSQGAGSSPTTTLYTYTYATSTNTQRQYIGEYYQPESELSYLNARWYDGERGRFLSQDPVFITKPEQYLQDPQQMNSYGYARNNPIRYLDPTGLSLKEDLVSLVLSLSGLVNSLMAFVQTKGSSGTSVIPPVKNYLNQSVSINPPKLTTWDPVTDKRISELDPRVRQPATNFINRTESELEIKLRVTHGYRTYEEQEKLYWQSRTNPPTGPWVTNARGGESNHNFGRAIDVAVMENGRPYAKPITSEIVNIGKQEGFKWGGDWEGGLYDPPHFEMYFGD